MLCVFICSPYRAANSGTHLRNTDYARQAMFDSFARAEAPFVPHILYPQILNDDDEVDHNLAIAAANAWMEMADTLAVYEDLGISAGMAAEIKLAQELDIHVEYRSIATEGTAA